MNGMISSDPLVVRRTNSLDCLNNVSSATNTTTNTTTSNLTTTMTTTGGSSDGAATSLSDTG